MLRGEHLGSLQFDDQDFFDKKVGVNVADESPIFVVDREGSLLEDVQTELLQSMGERVFIRLLEVTVAMVGMDVIGRLADSVARVFIVLIGNSGVKVTSLVIPRDPPSKSFRAWFLHFLCSV